MNVLRSALDAWPMVVVVTTGLVAAAVILERWWYFGRTKCDPGAFAGALRQHIRQGTITQAIDVCTKSPSPVARVAEQVLRSSAHRRDHLERSVAIASNREIVAMQRSLSTIAAMRWLAAAVTMFAAAVHIGMVLPTAASETGWNAALLAAIIGDALIALGGGALIASLAMVFHHIFEWKIRTRQNQMDSIVQALFEVSSKYDGAKAVPAGKLPNDATNDMERAA